MQRALVDVIALSSLLIQEEADRAVAKVGSDGVLAGHVVLAWLVVAFVDVLTSVSLALVSWFAFAFERSLGVDTGLEQCAVVDVKSALVDILTRLFDRSDSVEAFGALACEGSRAVVAFGDRVTDILFTLVDINTSSLSVVSLSEFVVSNLVPLVSRKAITSESSVIVIADGVRVFCAVVHLELAFVDVDADRVRGSGSLLLPISCIALACEASNRIVACRVLRADLLFLLFGIVAFVDVGAFLGDGINFEAIITEALSSSRSLLGCVTALHSLALLLANSIAPVDLDALACLDLLKSERMINLLPLVSNVALTFSSTVTAGMFGAIPSASCVAVALIDANGAVVGNGSDRAFAAEEWVLLSVDAYSSIADERIRGANLDAFANRPVLDRVPLRLESFVTHASVCSDQILAVRVRVASGFSGGAFIDIFAGSVRVSFESILAQTFISSGKIVTDGGRLVALVSLSVTAFVVVNADVVDSRVSLFAVAFVSSKQGDTVLGYIVADGFSGSQVSLLALINGPACRVSVLSSILPESLFARAEVASDRVVTIAVRIALVKVHYTFIHIFASVSNHLESVLTVAFVVRGQVAALFAFSLTRLLQAFVDV